MSFCTWDPVDARSHSSVRPAPLYLQARARQYASFRFAKPDSLIIVSVDLHAVSTFPVGIWYFEGCINFCIICITASVKSIHQAFLQTSVVPHLLEVSIRSSFRLMLFHQAVLGGQIFKLGAECWDICSAGFKHCSPVGGLLYPCAFIQLSYLVQPTVTTTYRLISTPFFLQEKMKFIMNCSMGFYATEIYFCNMSSCPTKIQQT